MEQVKNVITGGGVKDILIGFGSGIATLVAVKIIKIGVQKGYTFVKGKIDEKKSEKVEKPEEVNA